MKPLLIFFVLLFLGLMFLVTEHPEYNPLNQTQEVNSTGDVLKDAIKASDASRRRVNTSITVGFLTHKYLHSLNQIFFSKYFKP